jgi:pyridoxal phosphate enzyme (YggS family)
VNDVTGSDAVMSDDTWDRREELTANLVDVRARMAAAELAAGRAPGSVNLVAVTKTWPAEDVALLSTLGIVDVAENRHQEAVTKHDELRDLNLRWHFIGQLQRNKCRAVAQYADVVESVDRIELVGPLDRGAQEGERQIDALIQVDLQVPPEPHRGGAAPADVPALVEAVMSSQALRLTGVMAVAPLGENPRPAFDRLYALFQGLKDHCPDVTVMSAGMSDDLEEAVFAGTTHIRIGTAVLGRRPKVG